MSTLTPPPRPPTIATLASVALTDLYDPSKELKYYLRIAERLRKDANALYATFDTTLVPTSDGGVDEVRLRESERQMQKRYHDMEDAFVKYARAATLVMERLPEHPDYEKTLNKDQRNNLNLNGQNMMERMGEIKPILMRRITEWDRLYGPIATTPTQQHPHRHAPSPSPSPSPDPSPLAPTHPHPLPHPPSQSQQQHPPVPGATTDTDLRRYAALAAAARAAAAGSQERLRRTQQQLTSTSSSPPSHLERSRSLIVQSSSSQNQSTPEQDRARSFQEEGRRREEEIRRKKALERERSVSLSGTTTGPGIVSTTGSGSGSGSAGSDIVKRQKEANEQARVVRQTIEANNPGIVLPPAGVDPPNANPQAFLPLEPSWYENGDSTDSESSHSHHQHHTRRIEYPSPARGAPPTNVPAPTITTASHLPPAQASIAYPQLMNNHQQKQGYRPFSSADPANFAPTSAYPFPSSSHPSGGMTRTSILYPPHVNNVNVYQQRASMPQPYHAQAQVQPVLPAPPIPGYSMGPTRPAPAPPVPPHPGHHHAHPPPPATSSSTSTSSNYSHPHPHPHPSSSSAPPHPADRGIEKTTTPQTTTTKKLRQVLLPRDCLPRFLTIASSNTMRNLETCGLLLGRERSGSHYSPPDGAQGGGGGGGREGGGQGGGGREGGGGGAGRDRGYQVTTLLVPKQHATSDTCVMEGEEGVLAFTEGRGLITLGWIHTHPTQSCFMSSVDLHTHAGFQCMLKESFAVVCAPKSTPNFGIFRLTDPPGLDIVLQCEAKEAFHPHPDRPIYTDADKGHVIMRDMPLEIVDLR